MQRKAQGTSQKSAQAELGSPLLAPSTRTVLTLEGGSIGERSKDQQPDCDNGLLYPEETNATSSLSLSS